MIGFVTLRSRGLHLRLEAIESIVDNLDGSLVTMGSGHSHDVDENPDEIREEILASIKRASHVAAGIAQGIADDLFEQKQA